jgi:hypothetical protein
MSYPFRDRRILFGTIRFAVTVLWILTSAQVVFASSPDDPKGDVDQGVNAPAEERTGTKTVRVFYDPETGEVISVPFRETPSLSAPVARALIRSTEGLQVFKLENGGKGVHLDGRYKHAFMVRVRPDGSLETLCTDHSHGAEAFLKAGARDTKPEPQDK